MAEFNALPIDEMEAVWGGGFKRARAALDVTAFGMSVSDLPPDFDLVPAHTHTFDGQEEIYIALGGGGWLEVDGERVPLDNESIVLVEPAAIRRPISGPDGLRLLSVGAVPGQPYEVFPLSAAGSPEPELSDLPGVKAAAEAAAAGEPAPEAPRFIAKRFEEMDSYKGAFHYVRPSLGISAFGVAMIKLPPNYPDYPLHNEVNSKQEEVYVPLAGGGELLIDDETVAMAPGMMARVAPEPMRKVVPGDEGMEMLVLGGTPGEAYEPPDFGKVVRGDE